MSITLTVTQQAVEGEARTEQYISREEVDRLVDHAIRLKLDSRIVTLARALLELDGALNRIAAGVVADTPKARSYGGASWVSLTRKEMQEIARAARLPSRLGG